ncbi:MAG TPA: hypothetical protein PLZ31_11160 [Myxococcota bacterium]|nr:hypothetical protein [Myxococcota bacterium]
MGDRKYPSIFELALKAGKWSVLAGSGAAIIGGSTGCGSDTTGIVDLDVVEGDVLEVPDVMGVVDVMSDIYVQPEVKVDVPPDYGFPELMGVAPYDVGGWDTPDVDAEQDTPVPPDTVDATDDVAPDDVLDPDAVDPDAIDPDATGVEIDEGDMFLAGDPPIPDP